MHCYLRNKDGPKIHSHGGMVTPIELFQDPCGFWVAQIVVTENGESCWVRLITFHVENSFTHKEIPGRDI